MRSFNESLYSIQPFIARETAYPDWPTVTSRLSHLPPEQSRIGSYVFLRRKESHL